MGRGKDKVILGTDIPNMSPGERAQLGNLASTGRVRVTGTSVVRGKDGNAKYEDQRRAGRYGEDNLS